MSRFIAHLIFRIKFINIKSHNYYFDITTLALFKKVIPRLNKSNTVIDLGTGPCAVVGLSIRNKVNCEVVCVDINPELVALARKNIQSNKSSIKVIQSKFFDKVDIPFDTVLFNPPYIPTKTGDSWHSTNIRRSRWDGGSKGTDVIDAFLKALGNNKNFITAYLGVNTIFVPKKKMLTLLKKHPRCFLVETIHNMILPTNIYVIQNKRH